ncbi:hypothetical protein V7O67_07585 [Methanolobus sp. ZRKC4]|uniref:hypothetical protein n=1 Tax=Methanolobus sp. ZRKC4 TaxID=3125787 RepID=UPI003246161C
MKTITSIKNINFLPVKNRYIISGRKTLKLAQNAGFEQKIAESIISLWATLGVIPF